MNKTIGWSIVGTIIVIAGLILGVPHLLSGHPAGDTHAPTTQAIAPRPDCPLRTVRGVELECLGGEKGDAEDVDKQKTLINVWAWWCQPCRAELPVVEEFARAHPEYTVVGVHADQNAGNGAALLEDIGVGLPSYQDDSGAFAAEQGLPPVVPVTVVLRGGDQVAVFAREFTSAEELAAAVEGAL